MRVATEQAEQFRASGYCVFDRVIPPEHLDALDEACELHLARQKADMERVKAEVLGLSHGGRRYFLSCWHESDTAMARFLFGDTTATIVNALLGDDAFLFLELFVVKPPRTGMAFGWHQDSGYLLGTPHAPYVSLWCALDDATAENGALHVLPHDGGSSREIVPHRKEPGTGDLIGYRGEDSGVVVPARRGSIVALSSTLFHRSGPNITDTPRRAFLVAYSPEPITDGKGQLWNRAAPFLRGGMNVQWT